MKKQGYLAIGLAVGLLTGSCVSGFAAEAVQTVQAYVKDDFHFTVNGEEKTLDSEYKVLVYNDRTYLPVRGIGEMLDATINWDDATKTVAITTVEKKTDEKTSPEYKELPQIYEDYYIRVEAESLFDDDYGDRLFIKLKDKVDGKILRLVSDKTTYTVNGKTYSQQDTLTEFWDSRWYTSYADYDNDLEGYLRLPKGLKNYTELKVHLEVKFDDETETRPVEFLIKANPIKAKVSDGK